MSVFKRAERPDDPNRCQATGGAGQCPYLAIGTYDPASKIWTGPKYCARHGGHRVLKNEDKESQRMYMAALWKDRIGYQADHPKYKSLREEMGILRMTLERRLDFCKDDSQLMMYSGQITELVREIGKLAKTAHAIERDMGHLLDKSQAEAWIQELVGIIGNYITDPGDLQNISEDMIASLEARTGA